VSRSVGNVLPESIGDTRGAKRTAQPKTLAPQLATLVDAVPPGKEWLHELKYDGVRILCRVERREARAYSRNGKDWTDKFASIARAAAQLPVRAAWLDGEVCIVDPRGVTSFQALQNLLADPKAGKLVYFVFDLVHLDGYDLSGVALRQRKEFLRELVPEKEDALRYGVEAKGQGAEFLQKTCKRGLEGIVCKRLDSHYHAGARTRDWLKVKCSQRQEMVIGGFTDPQGARSQLGALLLGVYEPDGTLSYSGKVGTGFDEQTLVSLRRALDRLVRETPAFANPPRGAQARGVHWVKPELVAEIAFSEWTRDGTLRHPSFQGLREDKKAREVVRERPAARIAVKKKARIT
jgi:bifunctional non-homologous end joining protein LigD